MINKTIQKYDIARVKSDLQDSSEDDRISFMRTYFLKEADPKVLSAVLIKILKKAKIMGFCPHYNLSDNRKSGFIIQNLDELDELHPDIASLLQCSENAKVTFFHRYLWDEDHAYIIRAMAVDLIDRLIELELISSDFELEIDEEKYNQALIEFDNGNKKFYQSKSPGSSY